MNQLSLIRKINAIGEKYYSNSDTVDTRHNCYLDECNYWLIQFLKEQLKETYLFYVLTYMRKSGEVGFVNKVSCDTKNPSGKNRYDYNNSFKESFETILEKEYLPDIEKGNIISMTQNLLVNKTGYDIFFQGSKEYDTPVKDLDSSESKIIFFNLAELAFNPETQKLGSTIEQIQAISDKLHFEGTTQQIENLLCYYKRLEYNYKQRHPEKDFMVHFIRPYFIDFDYNLLFSLATNQPVSHELLSFINLIIHKIVSLMVIEKAEQKNVSYIYGVGHFFKTEFSPIVTVLSQNSSTGLDANGVKKILSTANSVNTSAKVLDLFAKALVNRVTDPSYNTFQEKEIIKSVNTDVLDENELQNHSLTIREILLSSLINEVVNNINELVSEKITVIFPQSKLLICPFLTFTTEQSDKEVILCPSKEVYQILFRELFKNISKSVNFLCKNVEITVSFDNNELILTVSRHIDASDSQNLQSMGIGFDYYSTIGDVLSGMKLVEMYVNVYGLGKIRHKQEQHEVLPILKTQLKLNGLETKDNEQDKDTVD